jgi:eukaryotic-like serine/threonine-protein kinase
MIELMGERQHSSWELVEGAQIAPGRSVLKQLGGGNRYEVMLVWDDRLFAITVAKVLRPDYAEDERALRELAEEAEALASLAHPVLVRGFDTVLEGPHPHLLIEHLEGPTLRRLLRRGGTLPLEQLLPLAAHVAAALQYMANEGWVHLDVKPDNIVMGVPPRLIDLSIARTAERAAGLRSPIGTDPYMAPEQCAPGDHPDGVGKPADVWGLGATLYRAVAGRRPFPRPDGAADSDDPALRFPQVPRDPDPLPESVPGELAALIERTLAKRPEDRPTAGELVFELEPLVDELPRKLTFARRGTQLR